MQKKNNKNKILKMLSLGRYYNIPSHVKMNVFEQLHMTPYANVFREVLTPQAEKLPEKVPKLLQ